MEQPLEGHSVVQRPHRLFSAALTHRAWAVRCHDARCDRCSTPGAETRSAHPPTGVPSAGAARDTRGASLIIQPHDVRSASSLDVGGGSPQTGWPGRHPSMTRTVPGWPERRDASTRHPRGMLPVVGGGPRRRCGEARGRRSATAGFRPGDVAELRFLRSCPNDRGTSSVRPIQRPAPPRRRPAQRVAVSRVQRPPRHGPRTDPGDPCAEDRIGGRADAGLERSDAAEPEFGASGPPYCGRPTHPGSLSKTAVTARSPSTPPGQGRPLLLRGAPDAHRRAGVTPGNDSRWSTGERTPGAISRVGRCRARSGCRLPRSVLCRHRFNCRAPGSSSDMPGACEISSACSPARARSCG